VLVDVLWSCREEGRNPGRSELTPKGEGSGWIEGTLRRSLSQGRMTWDAIISFSGDG
jgi:hypothetical protein